MKTLFILLAFLLTPLAPVTAAPKVEVFPLGSLGCPGLMDIRIPVKGVRTEQATLVYFINPVTQNPLGYTKELQWGNMEVKVHDPRDADKHTIYSPARFKRRYPRGWCQVLAEDFATRGIGTNKGFLVQ